MSVCDHFCCLKWEGRLQIWKVIVSAGDMRPEFLSGLQLCAEPPSSLEVLSE